MATIKFELLNRIDCLEDEERNVNTPPTYSVDEKWVLDFRTMWRGTEVLLR